MDSRSRLRSTLFVATSLATVTLAGCGIFEKQPPRYNTPIGARHVPVLNPKGEGLTAFEPRVARWTYEDEAQNIQAERTYPNTKEAAEADDYPDEAPMVPTAMPAPGMSAAPTGPGPEPSPLYYLEQQGLAPGQDLSGAPTAQAAPAGMVASAPLAPAQYEQQPVAPAETMPPQATNDTYPHLGDVPDVNQDMKNQANQARTDANQAFAEQPAMIQSTNEQRKELNNAADSQSMLPSEVAAAPQEEVLQEQPAELQASPQQRRMLTSEEVDNSVLPQGLFEQGQQQAAPAPSDPALQQRMDQEMMAINQPNAAPPPPPQPQPPMGMTPPPPQAYAPPPPPMMAPPPAPEGAYAPMPVQTAMPDEVMVDEPAPIATAPVLTPPQLTPPQGTQVSPLQRRQQYLQESRYARIRSVHRAPRQY